MVFEEYADVIKGFQCEASLSLTETFDAVCVAQDALIADIIEKGATIAGWKVVDKEGVIILSPIFDFQVFASLGETIPHQAFRGTELEVCFQLAVPSKIDDMHSSVAKLVPFAAVELIRAEIHPTNHSACDFYFNYGVFVSPKSVSGELFFEGGDQGYAFSADVEKLVEAKKEVLKKGALQCIQRGYGNKDYFFITGTLNGLVPAAESLGVNRVLNQEDAIIQFEIVE
jgi:hypothetical protein